MKFIADFHIHSHFSLATSKNLVPEYLDYWARLKGIDVLGTGDCIHPGWIDELKEKLEPADNGLYRLKKSYILKDTQYLAPVLREHETFFILTGEISNIYKKNGKVRKVHNLCVFPNFEAVEEVSDKLSRIGNIRSDGRPILGMDSKVLLDMVLHSSDLSYLIPAHIWTPWFSVLGSRSGFDTIYECYEDLTDYIFAVETGLSSDPPMNRSCRFLDPFLLVSNSDAHSPEKLGREANLFDTEIGYDSIFKALKNDKGFTGTIEFFPQEGKYHYDGHRKCNVCWNPLETVKNSGICTVCDKPVTKGVMYRVAELSDSSGAEKQYNDHQFYSITSLPDLLSEIIGKKPGTKSVQKEYFRILDALGSDLRILLFAEPDNIKKAGGEALSEGIVRMRRGEVFISEGFDGEFGRITLFNKDELREISRGNLLAGSSIYKPRDDDDNNSREPSIPFNMHEFRKAYGRFEDKRSIEEQPFSSLLTDEQREGVEYGEGACMVVAGPGSGKTRVLTERIFHLINTEKASQDNILAITFSNKASEEMSNRVNKMIPHSSVTISTFHAFGLSILKKHGHLLNRKGDFYLIDRNEKEKLMGDFKPILKRSFSKALKSIESVKQGAREENHFPDFFTAYQKRLEEFNAFDIDDLLYMTVALFKDNEHILQEYGRRYSWILIDEFQDINPIQYELILLLTSREKANLFIIGDPDQAIYGFRGSSRQIERRFMEEFSHMKIIRLNRSHRCPGNVLKAASQILQRNEAIDGREGSLKVEIKECATDKSEAEYTASMIEKMIGGVRSFSMNSGVSDGREFKGINSFSDFAVLCRTTHMFEPVITAFQNHGIAYQVVGSEPFYKEEPFAGVIKSFTSNYHYAVNGVKMPFHNDSLLSPEIMNLFTKKIDTKIILRELIKESQTPDVDKKRFERLGDNYDNDYSGFLASLTTGRGVDDLDMRAEAVSLMTMHSAKGLEFNVVMIPGCEDGIIPFELYGKKSDKEREEEERLFYVSLTRTKKYLFLSYAKKRRVKTRKLELKKSPFLNRIEEEILNFEIQETKKSQSTKQLNLFG